MSNRTGLRLAVQRDATMSSGKDVTPASSAPIIISQPIKFTGNKLVHLPPQIIHVESGSSSYGATPPKVTVIRREEASRASGSRGSPSEVTPLQGTPWPASPSLQLSPPGYADSPHSASFTSAQSEMDDIIIDEILSLEEEQQRRRAGFAQLGTSLQASDSRQVPIPSTSPGFYARQVSNSAPTSSFDVDGLKQEGGDEDNVRDRRKKDIHNMIERRRRYNINDRIKELGTMLPKHATGEDMKLNKGTILKASVDYIRTLQKETDAVHRKQTQQQSVEQQNRVMAQRIKELEQQLKQNNIPVPPAPELGSPAGAAFVQTSSGPQRIKEEPRDDVGSPLGWSGDGAPASSPSFSTMLGISQLALDPHHTYAATPSGSDNGGYGDEGGALETPPVQGGGYNSRVPLPPAQMHELMMDLASGLEGSKCSSPLLHPGDPMLPGGGGGLVPGLSPEVQWDSAAFSPESNTPVPDTNMDMSN